MQILFTRRTPVFTIATLLTIGMLPSSAQAQAPTPWQPRVIGTTPAAETQPPLPPSPTVPTTPAPPMPASPLPPSTSPAPPRPTALGIVLRPDSPSALEVDRVQSNSAAEWAGVRPGDIVIAINGRVVESIEGLGPESVLTMTVIRNGRPLPLNFVPPAAPPLDTRQRAGVPSPTTPPTMRPDFAHPRFNYYGYQGNLSGPNLPNNYSLWVPPGWPLVPYGPRFYPGPYRGRARFDGGYYRGRPDEVPPPWPRGY